MSCYIVSLKDDAPEGKLEEAKQKAIDQGGKIVQDMAALKMFTVEYPEDHITVLAEDEHIAVEKDQVVKTQ